jgi:hypothetical protein
MRYRVDEEVQDATLRFSCRRQIPSHVEGAG